MGEPPPPPVALVGAGPGHPGLLTLRAVECLRRAEFILYDRLVPPQESEAMYARAGEPKKLVVLKSFGHYEVYGGHAFRQVMEETLAWYGTHLPAP